MWQLLTEGKKLTGDHNTKADNGKGLQSLVFPGIDRLNKVYQADRRVAEAGTMVVSVGNNGGGVLKPVRTTPAREAVDPAKYIMLADEPDGTRFACSKCGNIYKWRKSLNKHWKEKHYREPLEPRCDANGSVLLLVSSPEITDKFKHEPVRLVNKLDVTRTTHTGGIKLGVDSGLSRVKVCAVQSTRNVTTTKTTCESEPSSSLRMKWPVPDRPGQSEIVRTFHGARDPDRGSNQRSVLIGDPNPAGDECDITDRSTSVHLETMAPVNMTTVVVPPAVSNQRYIREVDGVLDLSRKHFATHWSSVARTVTSNCFSPRRSNHDQPLDFSTKSSFPSSGKARVKEYVASKTFKLPSVHRDPRPTLSGTNVFAHGCHANRFHPDVNTVCSAHHHHNTETVTIPHDRDRDGYNNGVCDRSGQATPNIRPAVRSPVPVCNAPEFFLRCAICASRFTTMSEVNRHFAQRHTISTYNTETMRYDNLR